MQKLAVFLLSPLEWKSDEQCILFTVEFCLCCILFTVEFWDTYNLRYARIVYRLIYAASIRNFHPDTFLIKIKILAMRDQLVTVGTKGLIERIGEI